jgi:iron(III) transport system ATP-binding protein
VRDDGRVALGPFEFDAPRALRPGAVEVAVRPEAWSLKPSDHPTGLAATVVKSAYLGSQQEVTLQTALGEIFVLVPDVQHAWHRGDAARLQLSQQGVAVVTA